MFLTDWVVRWRGRGGQWGHDGVGDIRYAIRQLKRSPGFATAAILSLALGIGATTAIASVANAILLQPLPFPDSDRLVRIVEQVPPRSSGFPIRQRGIPYQDFLDWKAHARTLSDAFAVEGMAQRLVRTSGGTVGLWGATMTPNAFDVLGVRSMLGRTLNANDSQQDVVVLAFDTWRRHFDANPAVVGTTVELRAGALQGPAPRRLLTVVGVLPEAFELPTGSADFYTPLQPDPSAPSPRITMIGRLDPRVSLEAALDELNTMGAAARPPWPSSAPALTGPRFAVQRVKDLATSGLESAFRVFLAAVVLVLVIVCANVANLLLARGASRQQEMVVRFAVGASRGRVVRQVMTECLVLSVAGGALGALLGAAGVTIVKQLATVDAPGIFGLMFGSTILPRSQEVGIDATVFAIAFGVATVTGVLVGLLPALHLSRAGQSAVLGARGGGARAGSPQLGAALVVGQLALATVLLTGAGLLIHSFWRITGASKGYDPSRVVALQLLLPDQYSTPRKAETIDTMLARLRQLSGVSAVGFARHGVLLGEELTIGTFVPLGKRVEEMRTRPARPRVRSVSDGFLTAMGVPVLDGRDFRSDDASTGQPAVVLNRSAARDLFGTARAVGQPLDWYVGDTPVQVIVTGVVEDVRQESLIQDTFPEIYVHYRQFLSLMERWPDLTRRQNEWAIGFTSFAIRTESAPASVVPAIHRLVETVDPQVGIDALVPMTQLVAGSVARQRFSAVVLGSFAAVASALAALGVYGVLAYLVAQRTSEIGIRMALGARSGQVLMSVLRNGLLLATAGISLGIVAATAFTSVLEGMLFGVTALDGRTFAAVALLFGFVTILASYIPARRAARVNPMIALRNE
jgi:putative ABC transport system permease protein